MTISDYFQVVSTRDRVFHFQLKGLWSDEVAGQIGTQFLAQFKEAVDSMGGKKFLILVDSSKLRPPSEKAKQVISQTMRYAKEHDLYKAVEVMPSAVTRIAIRLAAEASGEDDFRVVVVSLAEGRKEINRLKKSL